eukprot:31045-Pelagococcus_subviridis.AAC.8
MINGRSAAFIVSKNGCDPDASVSRSLAESPRDSTGYVRSRVGPTLATRVPPATFARRRRAFNTGASERGSEPISRITSASSTPTMLLLNR